MTKTEFSYTTEEDSYSTTEDEPRSSRCAAAFVFGAVVLTVLAVGGFFVVYCCCCSSEKKNETANLSGAKTPNFELARASVKNDLRTSMTETELSSELGPLLKDGRMINGFAANFADAAVASDAGYLTTKNLVFSPWNLSMALAMVLEGLSKDTNTSPDVMGAFVKLFLPSNQGEAVDKSADSKAAAALLIKDLIKRDVLADWEHGSKHVTSFDVANRIYSDESQLRPDFVKKLKGDYEADAFSGKPLPKMDDVNKWIADQTHDMIPKFLSSELESPATYLFSILYFKASWQKYFWADEAQSNFRMADGTVKKVTYMKPITATKEFPELGGKDVFRRDGLIKPSEWPLAVNDRVALPDGHFASVAMFEYRDKQHDAKVDRRNPNEAVVYDLSGYRAFFAYPSYDYELQEVAPSDDGENGGKVERKRLYKGVGPSKTEELLGPRDIPRDDAVLTKDWLSSFTTKLANAQTASSPDHATTPVADDAFFAKAFGVVKKGPSKDTRFAPADEHDSREQKRSTILKIPEMDLGKNEENLDVKKMLSANLDLKSVLLDKMYEGENGQIMQLVHKAVVKVDVMGSAGAAASMMETKCASWGGGSKKPTEFVDPPHLFKMERNGVFGILSPSGSVLFMSVVNDPGAGSAGASSP